MQFFVLFALAVVGSSARLIEKRAAGNQNPKVWDALRVLRGGKDLSLPEILDILSNAVPGKDYPINAVIPANNVNCASYKQPGFYADDSAPSNCQVFHRCDNNGLATSYLCPNQTLFNQITLICDWFYNVDCANSKQFQDYSNSRLDSQNEPLLDNQDVYEVTGAAKAVSIFTQSLAPKSLTPVVMSAPEDTKKGGTLKVSGSASSSSFSTSSSTD